MPMTKKESARVEALMEEAALRRTAAPGPDVPVPKFSDALAAGFLYSGECSDWPRVELACSSTVHHGLGSATKTMCQGPRALFSTRLRALKALRVAVEQDCARRLRRVDRMIEDAEGQPF